MNITVKVLRQVYGVTPEDISNALMVKSSDVIKRCLNDADTYGAFVAIGVLIPRELLKFESQKVQDENEKKWKGIRSIFDALAPEKQEQKARKPRNSSLPASIEADVETFKSMCLDTNCSYHEIGKKFGMTTVIARYYAVKLDVAIERPRGRKKTINREAPKPQTIQNPFAGFNTSPKPGF